MSNRAAAIDHVKTRLLSRASPRLHMSVIIAAAGGAGFVASYAMLKMGVVAMALRYPLAVCAAYLVFLGLISAWLRRYQLSVSRTEARDREAAEEPWSGLDIVDIPLFDPSGFPGETAGDGDVPGFGGGGGFSGGGAGARLGAPVPAPHAAPLHSAGMARPAGGGAGKGGGFSLDIGALDEGAWVLIPVAIAAAVALGAALYVVYIAPILFAELLLDAALAAGLYRRLRGVRGEHWVRSAIRRTAGPAIVAAVLLAVAGGLMQRVYPGAASIGRVWERAMQPEGEELSPDAQSGS